MQEQMMRVALKIEAKLKENAPVDTGNLRNSIVVVPSKKGITISMANYGEEIEYGFPAGTPVDPNDLKDWARRVLGDESLAYPVAKYLQRHGKKPNPFIRETLFKHLKSIVKEEFK